MKPKFNPGDVFMENSDYKSSFDNHFIGIILEHQGNNYRYLDLRFPSWSGECDSQYLDAHYTRL